MLRFERNGEGAIPSGGTNQYLIGVELTIAEFNEFVSELYPELLRAANRLCNKDYEMAEDAVQNALFLAYEKLDQFQIQDHTVSKFKHFRGWIHKILSNMAMQMRTRKSGAPKPNYQKYAYASFVIYDPKTIHFSKLEEDINYRNPTKESIEAILAFRCKKLSRNKDSQIDYIMEAINTLPVTPPKKDRQRVEPTYYREIAKFTFVDELTSPEIAARLHLAEVTIRKRIWQIKELLREKLVDHMVEA